MSEETKHKSEVLVVYVAIASFLLHLGLIVLVDLGLVEIAQQRPGGVGGTLWPDHFSDSQSVRENQSTQRCPGLLTNPRAGQA